MSKPSPHEERYLKLLLDPLEECARYKPKFGTNDEEGISLERFTEMYGKDPFYHWIGLDSPLMYAAHKAAGGMTSVYRQIGTGCDNLFRAVVQDSFGLSAEQVQWSYEIEKEDKSIVTLTLDARIDLAHVGNKPDIKERVRAWLDRCGKKLGLPDKRIKQIRGAVFEARQGYKSADAKRQNADLRFGRNADAQNYLPVLAIISTQASQTVVRRYKNAKMLVLTGTKTGSDVDSTYEFFRNVVGFELDNFFERNSPQMRKRCVNILERLLAPA
jgi:hypothetical protein